MNSPTPPPEDRETRLTALLLGELPPAEAAALRQELEHDADLRRLHDRLAATLQLVRDASAITDCEPDPSSGTASPRLADDRRAALLASFKVVPTRPSFWQRWTPAQRRELAAVAAMLAALLLIASLLLPIFSAPKTRAQRRPALLIPVPDATEEDFAVASIPPPPVVEPPRLKKESLRLSEGRDAREREVAAATAPTTAHETELSLARDKAAAAKSDRDTVALFAGVAQNLNFSTSTENSLGRTLATPLPGSPVPSTPAKGEERSVRFLSPAPIAANAPAQPPPAPPAASAERKAQEFAQLGDMLGRGTGGGAAPAAKPVASGRSHPAETLLEREELRAGDRLSTVDREAQGQKRALAESAPAAPAGTAGVSWDADGDRAKDVGGLGLDRDSKGSAQERWYFGQTAENGRQRPPNQAGQGGFGGGVSGQANARNDFFFRTQSADEQPRDERFAFGSLTRQAGRSDGATPTYGFSMVGQQVPPASTPVDHLGLTDQSGPQETEARRKLNRTSATSAGESDKSAGLNLDSVNGTDAPLGPRSGARRADETPKGSVEKAKKQLADLAAAEPPATRPAPGPAVPAPVPQPEVASAENAFSTFSLNVSDVSFKLAAASLDQSRLPEAAGIRTEEFINAFNYRDPEPSGSAPVSLAWDRARSPWAHDRDVVRFSVKTAASGRQPGRPLNLVLALDNSGSMERADRVRILQESLRVLATQLRPGDRVSLVTFARTARLVVDGLPGERAHELARQAAQLTPQGGTNLEEALGLAWQTARRHFLPQGVNRVVLLTDGAANLGDFNPASLKAQVEAQRRQGIALDCFGIGWEGYEDELLEQLSRNGDGRYGFINSPAAATTEFARQLAGALQVAASDVKVQVEWNPRRVRTWRQIGYARHQLTREQFRDNTVDAAELGAAEAGTALYTVQVDPAGEGPLGTVRVRFKVPGTSDYRELAWTLTHQGTARALDQAPASLRLAATAAAFGEWLAGSPYAAEVTPDRLLATLRGVPETWSADPRPAQLQRMLQQARSLRGK